MSRIATCQAFLYELPLRVPIRFRDRQLTRRTGLLIRIETDQGHRGYGEAAPLPGLHREDVATVAEQFQRLRPQLIGQPLMKQLAELRGSFSTWLPGDDLSPSLRYGLEMAVLNTLAQQRQTTLAGLLAPTYCRKLPVNGLIMAGEDVVAQAQHFRQQGYQAVKLKVGRSPLAQDIANVRHVRQALGPAIKLRLDANRSWELPTAVAFGKAIADCEIEYLEEPLVDAGKIAEFYQATGVPVALDESLQGQVPASLQIPPGVAALVLKPAVLGGFEITAGYVERAKQSGIPAVVSSVFESGVGLAALANFAAARCGDVPAGLDTYRWLAEDLLVVPFRAEGGWVEVEVMDGLGRQGNRINLKFVHIIKKLSYDCLGCSGTVCTKIR